MSEERSLYKLSNLDKKSVYTREYWSSSEHGSFEIEEMFRWGETVLNLTPEEREEIEEQIKNGDTIMASNYEIYDQDLMDGCSLYFEECEGPTVELLEMMWDTGGFSSFEEAGYDFDDVEVQYVGACTLEPYEDPNGD